MDFDMKRELAQVQKSLEGAFALMSGRVEKVTEATKRIEQLEKRLGELEKEISRLQAK